MARFVECAAYTRLRRALRARPPVTADAVGARVHDVSRTHTRDTWALHRPQWPGAAKGPSIHSIGTEPIALRGPARSSAFRPAELVRSPRCVRARQHAPSTLDGRRGCAPAETARHHGRKHAPPHQRSDTYTRTSGVLGQQPRCQARGCQRHDNPSTPEAAREDRRSRPRVANGPVHSLTGRVSLRSCDLARLARFR
jgi:hypothetical protein